MAEDSTSAYADAPKSGEGPGVLVLHSWWGLTDAVKSTVNDLADAGFTALAPDLFGELADDAEHGEQLLADADVDQLVMGVLSCADALRNMPATPDGPIKVVGFSMGASLGLWLSEREPELVSAVVGYYGTQSIDFTETRSAYQFHMAADDPMVDEEELVLMQASIGLAGRPIELHTYDDVGHWFAESDTPGYDEEAAAKAWHRTLDFLRVDRTS
ncbi:MAG: alpha/beta fold hydrolase [Acidimicrobiales bacterium]|nr:alpha/beta fold hydrolase [Acidimicrobiales bacterium]